MSSTPPSAEEMIARIQSTICYLQREDLSPEEELIRNQRVLAMYNPLRELDDILATLGFHSGVNFMEIDE